MDGPMGAPFVFYTPELSHLQQKRSQYLTQSNAYHSESPQLLAPTPISFPSQLVLGGRGVPLSITPSASPSLMEPYVPGDICTESATSDMFFNSATPPLTHSGLSTPSISYGIHTPISNHGWSSVDEPMVTTVAPLEVQLAGTHMEYIPVGLMAPTVVKSNASPPPSIAVNDIHCPALSPCSSQDSFAAESDFCDPRQLTIDIATPISTPIDINPDVVFPPMPTFCGDDDEFLFGGNVEHYLPLDCTTKSKPYIAGDFNEELSDLGDSEDDFIQNFTESVHSSSSKRVKYDSDSDIEQLPSPPMSTSSSREGSVAPSKSAPKRKLLKKRSECCDEMSEEQRIRSFKFGNSAEDSDDSSCCSPSDKLSHGNPISPNVVRRGRKQSLTEDPSKTFVCHLCNRRFRRQEHLKRHFRSLHTEDKPFSCNECGKRFSRSDNLTQHSRIHGTGAVVLGVLTEDDVPVLGSQYSISEEPELLSPIPSPLGLGMDSIDAMSGESKESQSSEDKKARRKRKRSDE